MVGNISNVHFVIAMESQSGRFVTRSHSPQSPPNDPDDMPACQSCRKRKLKCNRELPSCSQCSRLCKCPCIRYKISFSFSLVLTCQSACDCIYAGRKQKPGLRSGAIDGLNRRIGMPGKQTNMCNNKPSLAVDYYHRDFRKTAPRHPK